jgi:hypothetical protein
MTVAVRVIVGSIPPPECNDFNAALLSSTGNWVQTIAPKGAGMTLGVLGYMLWGAGLEEQYPITCEGGVGVGAKNYNVRIPMPPLRQQ